MKASLGSDLTRRGPDLRKLIQSTATCVMLPTLFLLLANFAGNLAIRSGRFRRVVGGHRAAPYTRPYQVLLVTAPNARNESMTCGGSIMNEWYILTAAHCCIETDDIVVVAGLNDISEPGALAQYRKANGVQFHSSYNGNCAFDDDICVLRVHVPLKLDSYVSAVTLASPGQKFRAKSKATASGWGEYRSHGSSNMSNVLRQADLTVMSDSSCKRKVKELTGVSMRHDVICTFDQGKDLCVGDSGGPLMCEGGVQCGIISAGNQDCDSKIPALYTRVSEYRSWIKTAIASIESNKTYNFFTTYERRQEAAKRKDDYCKAIREAEAAKPRYKTTYKVNWAKLLIGLVLIPIIGIARCAKAGCASSDDGVGPCEVDPTQVTSSSQQQQQRQGPYAQVYQAPENV